MLFLVRHGQTAANAVAQIQGRRDLPLTDLGRAQAATLAAALPADLDLVVSSPLRRARETAAALGHETVVDERWTEIDFGEWEGRLVASMTGPRWASRLTDPAWSPPGGEALSALGDRVRSACEGLVEQARSGHVAVVSHVTPVKVAAAWALGAHHLVAWRMFIDLASVTSVRITDQGPVLVGLNQTSHLGAAPS